VCLHDLLDTGTGIQLAQDGTTVVAHRLIGNPELLHNGCVPPGWPNLFIVGVPKGGTTSLWRYLDRHPAIYMSRVKEPNFFLAPDAPVAVPTEEEYRQLFAGASTERWLGEASPRYFADPRVPGRIRRAVPEARILITLRDPVERAWSHYWHNVKFGVERRSFAEAVVEQLAQPARRDSDNPCDTYVPGGMYSGPVRRYLDTFGDAVFALVFEELRDEPQREVASILEFLGLRADAAYGVPLNAHNVFALPRGPVARMLMASPRARAVGRKLFPEPVRTGVERLVLERGRKPRLDEELRARLRDAFEPDRVSLERLLGRPLLW